MKPRQHGEAMSEEKKPMTILELEAILLKPHKGYVIRPDGSIVDSDSEIARLRASLEAKDAHILSMQRAWVKLIQHWANTEARSEEAHAIYQKEAHGRGDVRHPDKYSDLSEPTKEWDRVLVRWVERKLEEWHTFDNGDQQALRGPEGK